MKTSQALVILYKIINEKLGPIHAKEAVTSAMFNVFSEFQEEGSDVTVIELEKKIESYVNDFVIARKKSDVA